jgi:mannose-6-phosphate isomerase-like protein (cupin superfamily)
MAHKNKVINNPIIGQNIKFLQTAKDTDGKLIEMEASYRPYSKEPPPHYHPYQEEDFIIVKGQMTVRIEGKILLLNEGDTLHIPANTVHSMWNNSAGTAITNWKVQPALTTEYFFETASGLASDKKRSKRLRSLLQKSLMANKYSNVFRLSKPPFFIQKILFIVLTPFAWFIGYRASYKRYFD